MRLFIALEAPEPWRAAALEQQHALLEALPPSMHGALRPVAADAMHLTLQFLGDVDEGGVDPLQAALDALPPVAMELALASAGTFGPPARTSVAWLGVAGDLEALHAVVERVREAVRIAGLPAEQDRFSAHLTLARVGRDATAEERRAVAEAARALHAPPPLPWVAREVLLVRSHLGGGPGGTARYEVLSRHP